MGGYGSVEGSGIILRANSHASYLPLDNEGTYAVISPAHPVQERVDFINVSLNDRAMYDRAYEGMPEESNRSPAFSLSGKVVCTLTFQVDTVYHVGDGTITYDHEENHYDYMNNNLEELPEPILVTYTITIDGTSNGIYADYLYEGAEDFPIATGVCYNRDIRAAEGEAVYEMDIDIDGESTHYDLKDPKERISWLSVDITFNIAADWSMKTMEQDVSAYDDPAKDEYYDGDDYEYYEEEWDRNYFAGQPVRGFPGAARATLIAVCGALAGLLGCAISNTVSGTVGMAAGTKNAAAGTGDVSRGGERAGGGGIASESAGGESAASESADGGGAASESAGDESAASEKQAGAEGESDAQEHKDAEESDGESTAEDTPEDLPEEDTEGVSVEMDVLFSDLLNEKGAAVTIPVEVSGGEAAKWHILVKAVCPDAPKAVVASVAGNNVVLALTGNMNGNASAAVTLFVTAWSYRADATIQKGAAAEELTIHEPGIEAERKNGELEVTLYTASKLKGVAELTKLEAADYEIADGTIKMKKEPYYSCKER